MKEIIVSLSIVTISLTIGLISIAHGQGQTVEQFNAKTIDTCIVAKLSNLVIISPKCGEYYPQAINKMLSENFTIKAVDNTGIVYMEKIKWLDIIKISVKGTIAKNAIKKD